ncbi:MAG TPA: hypothetical protein PLW39_02110 [Thermoflexales bacterium]|nr:hypothetical protein [Thermoflexales bacterium]HQW35688.1 hypothetical protein [Thermoflexales bacterium]HQZ21042.1 hypothetical protein [Thermoflexales bacterium]
MLIEAVFYLKILLKTHFLQLCFALLRPCVSVFHRQRIKSLENPLARVKSAEITRLRVSWLTSRRIYPRPPRESGDGGN